MKLLIFIVFVVYFMVERIRKRIRDKKIGWKAIKESHDVILYLEKIDNEWKQIEIHRAYANGTFFPDFKNENDWKDYPVWAQDRATITKRVLKRFPRKKDSIDDIGSHLNS